MAIGSSDQNLASLRRALLSPPVQADAELLARLFRIDIVSVTALRPASLDDYPDLVLRVRGAFGNKLYAMRPPPPLRCGGYVVARAWDVLQEEQLPSLAKPLVLHVDVIGNTIAIHAHLIGHAGFWQPDVTAALVAACDGGVTLANYSQIKTIFEVVEIRSSTCGGFEPSELEICQAYLQLVSPLRLRSGGATKFSTAAFLIALANRVKNLAAWHGVQLVEDWQSLHKLAWSVECSEDELRPYRWERGSRRMESRIPVLGFVGSLMLRGNLRRFIPYLQIGEMMNVGSHAALGLGRYRLALLP